eukprot:288494_1
MPTVLRRINRIFRRNSRDSPNNNNSNSNSNNASNSNINMHNYKNNNVNCSESDSEIFSEMNGIKLSSTGYERQTDGSVKLSVRLDKDQVECCVCLSSMTDKIYRCRGNRNQSNSNSNNNNNKLNKKPICHNICASCHWNMSRMKASNGHTKQMQCPICKIKGSFIRNYALERQLTELSNVCMHNKCGCQEKFFPWDLEQKDLHEKHLCVYQPIDCPFCHQSIIGGRINFIEHLVKSINKQNENENENEDSDINNNVEVMDEDIILEDENEEISDSSESEEIVEEIVKNNDFVPGCSIPFYKGEEEIISTLQPEKRNIIHRNRNEFIVNYNLGIVICFIAPSIDCYCWTVYCISINPRHKMSGNTRIYIQYSNYDKMLKFIEKEKSLGIISTLCLNRPSVNTLILSLNRLHPTSLRKLFNSYPINNPFIENMNSNNNNQNKILNNNNQNICEMKDDENSNNNEMELDITEAELDDLDEYKPKQFVCESPCSPIECGFIYGGFEKMKESIINNLYVRIFTLEESFKVGSIIDARDFTGKWYQVEIISVQDFNGKIYDNLDNDNDDYLEIRKAKVHYLGYSQNYDEWLNIDTDSHRIAHRGTFTIGPDLRAVRRNTTHNRLANNRNRRDNNNQNNSRSSQNNNPNNQNDGLIDIIQEDAAN